VNVQFLGGAGGGTQRDPGERDVVARFRDENGRSASGCCCL